LSRRVAAYAARFPIETGFRDAKQAFGLTTYQVRNETGFVRLVHLCLWAQTLLHLRCWNTLPSENYGGWHQPLSYFDAFPAETALCFSRGIFCHFKRRLRRRK